MDSIVTEFGYMFFESAEKGLFVLENPHSDECMYLKLSDLPVMQEFVDDKTRSS